MIASIAFVLLGASVATTPCENLTTLKLTDATITSATVVPEGPPQPAAPRGAAGARGAGGGARGAGGGQRGAGGAVPAVPGNNAAPPAARGPAAPPANIPAHCKVVMVLKPTSDSLINMEMWL